MQNNTPKEILKLLKETKTPICCMDSRFDFDALCAPYVLRKILKTNFGTDLRITRNGFFSNRTKETVDKFIDLSVIEENVDPNDIDFSKHDLLIVLDAGDLSHITETGEFNPNVSIKILNIDHHESNDLYGNFNYVKILGAACTVFYELLKKMDLKVDKEMAKILLLGIITDNGFFQFNTTTSEDLRIAAEIQDMGVNMYDLIWHLNFNENLEDMKLKAVVYSNLKILPDKKMAYVVLTKKLLADNSLNLDETVVPPADLIKRLRNTNFVMVINELDKETNTYNVSLRAHYPHIDVAKLAEALGGGGHKMAAGVNLKAKKPEEIVAIVLEVADKLGITI